MASAPPRIPGLSDWRPLARGGFATVWEARQESLNRLVAVKIDQRVLDVDTERRRFLREAGAAGRMSGHPGIVTVHDAGILDDNRPYLVMELCPGGSLTRWLKAETRPTQSRVAEVGVRIADALAAAHSRGVLHRDVKPANILIDSYDNPGLADFGLAAMPEPGEELSETLEAITPAYAPPEAFRQQAPTEFGDVFSLAATLYALLKGQPPRWREGGTPSVQAALELQHLPIERIRGVDSRLMDLLMTAMADEPSDRPTAAQFRDQLAALRLPGAEPPGKSAAGGLRTAGASVLQGRPDRGDRSSEVRRQRRSLLALAVVGVLLIAFVVIAFTPRPSTQVGLPAPAVDTAPVGPAPTPTGMTSIPIVEVPRGFLDCSADLGEQTYCASALECWGSLPSAFDQPTLGVRASCRQDHIYQTFAAGRLAYDVRRQSQLDQDKRVQRVCTGKVVNSMLARSDRRRDWEVYALPPQADKEDYFRCVFGRGMRSDPLTLEKPS